MNWLKLKQELPSIIFLSACSIWLTMNFPAYQGLGIIWRVCFTIIGVLGLIHIFSNAQEYGAQIRRGFETPGQPYYLEIAGKAGALAGIFFFAILAWYFDWYGMSHADYLMLYSYFLVSYGNAPLK